MAKSCGPSAAQEAKWRAQSDADTLMRAGEIMGDRGRLRAAQAEVKKSAQALQKITEVAAPRGSGLGLAKGRR